MIKLTYQEINKIINRSNATFYISGLPEKDCINTGKQVLYDYNLRADPDGVIIIKHYDTLVQKRDFKKRGLTLTATLLLFAFYMATFYIFVEISDEIVATSFSTWVLFLVYLIIPAIFFYPYTRKKVFLYQVLGYKVEALSDVISGGKFLLQSSLIIAIAGALNLMIAHLKGYDIITAIIACTMMSLLIMTYKILVLTRLFSSGKSIFKFNHKVKVVKEVNGDNEHMSVKSDNKLKYKINRAAFLAEQKLKKEQSENDVNSDIDVLVSEDIEVEESTKDLAEISILMDQILNEEVERAEYDVDFEDYEEEATIVLEPSQIMSLADLGIEEETIEEDEIDNAEVKDIATLLSEITGNIVPDNSPEIDDVYNQDTIDEMDNNLLEIISVINNKNIDMDVAPDIDKVIEVEEDLVDDIEPDMELHTEVDNRLEEETEVIDNDDIEMNIAPSIDEIVETEVDVLDDIELDSSEKSELDEKVEEEVNIIEEKLS